MKIWLAREIVILFTYWQKPELIFHADAVESAVLILV